MVLPVIKYGTPVLRHKGARVESVTPTIKKLVADMFETMYAYKGVGLAAQQVGLALQVTTIDIRGITDRPSWLETDGRRIDPEELMPLALINPELTPVGEPVKGAEGCLSFPELYADITRPETVDVKALGLEGQELKFRCGGLLARAIQHETDHLHGILFIDRMDRKTKAELRDELDLLQAETKALLR
jgi:peptide deformylase